MFQPIVGSTAKRSLLVTRDLSCTAQVSVCVRKFNSRVSSLRSRRAAFATPVLISSLLDSSYDNWIGVHVTALFNEMLYNHHWSWYLVSQPQRPISNVGNQWPAQTSSKIDPELQLLTVCLNKVLRWSSP
jgi:hypothetical protein